MNSFSLNPVTCNGICVQYLALKFLQVFATEMTDHKKFDVGTYVWRSSDQNPLLKQVHLKQIAQDHIFIKGWFRVKLDGTLGNLI